MGQRHSFWQPLIWVLLLGGVLLLYGMWPSQTPGAALATALAQSDQVSGHFVLTMTITQPGDTVRFAGDVIFPDRVRGAMEAPGEREDVVIIGHVMYTQRLPDGVWEKQVLPARPLWLSQLMSSEAVSPAWPQAVGKEWVEAGLALERLPAAALDGILCDRYRIRGDLSQVARLVRERLGEEDPLVQAFEAKGSESVFEILFWVGQADRRLYGVDMDITWTGELLAALASTLPPEKRPPAERPLAPMRLEMHIRYSDYGKPVSIEPPV